MSQARASTAFPSIAPPQPVIVGRRVGLVRPVEFSIEDHLTQVDGLITHTISELAVLWTELPDNGAAVDILGKDDVPALLSALAGGGGKRLRPAMCALGWLASGGRDRDVGRAEVVRVSAALELLHVFALVHDDVMDESGSRRGRPTVHVQAERLHELAEAGGSAQRFGESIAILVGDLAHSEASNLVAALPASMRSIWRLLVTELVAGQRRDLIGSAAGRRDLEFARTVARMKSGRYTVERPLELGAAAAGADRKITSALATYGRAIGEAFALRDDLLGISGDPKRTGKPAGDDLISGKPTVIVALAQRRLRSSSARSALRRVGTPEFSRADLALLLEEFQNDGICQEVERMITEHVQTAVDALAIPSLDPDGVAQLTRMANTIAWRDR